MKKVLSILIASVMLSVSTGCFGEFALTRTLYEWNDDVHSDKFVKSIVFWALNIIPVYSIAGFADVVILNLVEFWTGSNPMAMQEGEIEKQIIPIDGEDYIVEATKNQFKMYPINKEFEAVILQFQEEDKSWNVISNNEEIKLISLVETAEGSFYSVNTPDGKLTLDAHKTYSHEFLSSLVCDNKTNIALK